MSYLPLAHSFELNMQILILSCASSIGFYQGDVRKLVGMISTRAYSFIST